MIILEYSPGQWWRSLNVPSNTEYVSLPTIVVLEHVGTMFGMYRGSSHLFIHALYYNADSAYRVYLSTTSPNSVSIDFALLGY